MKFKNKIKGIEEVVEFRNKNREKKFVVCVGVFDVLHPGHLYNLMFAKSQGDYVIVAVTADDFVDKGPGRPFIPENIRAEILASLEFVDFVVLERRKALLKL